MADTNGIAIIIVEAYEAGAWNIDNVAVMRDDEAFIYGDVSFIKRVIDTTKESYSIDETRIYATGHSSGGGR